jgi:hypothetical protein
MAGPVVEYPSPPWHTHGKGAGAAYVVPVESIVLPDGFTAMSLLGRAMGVLSYVEYMPPSPLSYSELIWMPAMVRHGNLRGYWVEKMYVDDEASLAAGREVWALPKSLARFERDGEFVRIAAEDGTEIELRMRGFGPRKRLSSRVATLQHRDGEVVQFQCSFDGTVQIGTVDVVSFSAGGDGWPSFQKARKLPGSAGLLRGFEATMHPPRR